MTLPMGSTTEEWPYWLSAPTIPASHSLISGLRVARGRAHGNVDLVVVCSGSQRGLPRTYRDLWSRVQCMGPVVVLNAAG
jgi:hypothetical protein